MYPTLSLVLALVFLRSNKLVWRPEGEIQSIVKMQTGCQSRALLKPAGHLAGRSLASLFSLWHCWQTWPRLHCIWTDLSMRPASEAGSHQSHSCTLRSCSAGEVGKESKSKKQSKITSRGWDGKLSPANRWYIFICAAVVNRTESVHNYS